MSKSVSSAREAAIRIITVLKDHGHTAYLAGGCVRDALLGTRPKDYDVATDAKPKDVQKLFPRSAAVGAAFGVIIVYTPKPSPRHRWVTEVATFRAEGAYSDGRRPDAVRFTNAQEDAIRRDFTINGLFAEPGDDPTDPSQDRIIDYVQGRQDLEARVIRAIGDPGERFGEDYLRMLRAVRFAARLGFEIDAKTSAAIRAHARYLGQISRERIGQELIAMLQGPRPAAAIELLQQHKLDAPTLNEDPGEHPLTVTQRLGPDAEPATRLAGWLVDRHGQAHTHQQILGRWRKALSMSNEHRDEINALLNLMPMLKDWGAMSTAKRKRLAAQENWEQALLLHEATGGDAQRLRIDTQAMASDGIGLEPRPLLNGDDLIARGMQPGPAFKTLLDDAYDQQLEGTIATRQDALAWLESHDTP